MNPTHPHLLTSRAPCNRCSIPSACSLRFSNRSRPGRSIRRNGCMRWTGWLENWSEDERAGDLQMVDSKSFSVGHNLATTPGSVVFRNELIELIHYAPVTEQVHAVPLVFVPPWINKFYILDLNEKKSMVRYLLKQGFSVFVISWRNPDASMANTTFEDYVLKGVLAAIEAARALCGVPQVHAIGYCLGGTTLATLMAWLNREYEGKPGIPVSTLRPAVSNSLLSRIKKASLPMTNTCLLYTSPSPR